MVLDTLTIEQAINLYKKGFNIKIHNGHATYLLKFKEEN